MGRGQWGEAERLVGGNQIGRTWVRESEFCFITIIAFVNILVLDVMRKRLGSQRQGRVWRYALTLTFIRVTGHKATSALCP